MDAASCRTPAESRPRKTVAKLPKRRRPGGPAPWRRQAQLGRRLSIFWEGEKAWFPGTVAHLIDKTIVCVYDDGDRQVEDLGRARFRWIGPAAGLARDPDATKKNRSALPPTPPVADLLGSDRMALEQIAESKKEPMAHQKESERCASLLGGDETGAAKTEQATRRGLCER